MRRHLAVYAMELPPLTDVSKLSASTLPRPLGLWKILRATKIMKAIWILEAIAISKCLCILATIGIMETISNIKNERIEKAALIMQYCVEDDNRNSWCLLSSTNGKISQNQHICKVEEIADFFCQLHFESDQ